MYKLLALDIDNTILGRDETIFPEVKASLNAVVKNGIALFLTSGRGVNGVLKYKRLLGLDSAYCCGDNGATVFSSLSDVEITATIPFDESKKIVTLMKDKGIETVVSSHGKIYFEKISDLMLQFMFKFNDDIEKIQVEDISKIEDVYKICMHFNELNEFDYAESIKGEHTEFSQGYNMFGDYTPKGVTKGTALQKLCKKLHISASEVAAAGDADNDIPLLVSAGFACAMENATDSLKQKADVILPSCDEMGVKYMIDKFILINK